MQKIKSIKYQLLILFAFTACYSIIIFLIGNNINRGLDKAFITTYILMMISIVIYLINLFISNNKKVLGAIDAVNGPNTVALVFLVASFVLTTVLYFINFSKAIIWIIIGYIALFGIFIIFYILSFRQQELINENPNKIPDIYSINELATYLSNLSEKVTHSATKQELDLLIHEVLNLSFDNESENIKRIDKSIIEYSSLIKRNVERAEYSNLHYNISKVKELIEKRKKL